MTINPEIYRYYEEAPEETRLETSVFQLEFERTKEVLEAHLPDDGVVMDVGGGPGVYARWLADKGYEVHLVDPIERFVALAEKHNATLERPVTSCRVGDARSLDRASQSVDALLLLGPLYHLPDRSDRVQALREAHRVLRPGGRVFAAVISRYASILDGVSRDLLSDARFVEITDQDLAEGQHRNPTDDPQYFTTAYLHKAEELEDEMREAGFADASVLGLEGPGWLFADFDARWADPERRANLVTAARRLERSGLREVSAHMLGIGARISEQGPGTGDQAAQRPPP